MSQIHTKILSVPHTPVASTPADFGLTFRDQAASPNSPWREPCESLRVDFTNPVAQNTLTTAASHLRKGELVAFPTETVYGLGACALWPTSAQRIYAAKNRPADNPLIVHISDRQMLRQLVPDNYEFSPACEALMNAFWPGPLTLLFPVGTTLDGSPRVPSTVTCGQPTVGVRMPSHPVARALIALAGVPVAAPSANASGRPSPTAADHVYTDLSPRHVLSYIVDGGECSIGLESTVVDATTAPGEVRVLRPGGVSTEQIAAVLSQSGLTTQGLQLRVYGKDMARNAAQEAAPTTPGMKYRHYSPEARVILLQCHSNDTAPTLMQLLQDAKATMALPHDLRVGLLCATDSPILSALPDDDLRTWASQPSSSRLSPVLHIDGIQLCVYSMGEKSSPAIAAQRLFDGLRSLDALVPWDGAPGACDLILAEAIPEEGVGLAVMNRLNKAASTTAAICMQ
ncbi:nucleotidyltransferase [Malassezia pachydermatis]|uniref:Threonylcarbamoyl-AMP synthase n=1 Tax=Malassezia pachydermatis TaxID=77020 RepID=A0A0M8MR43_9BASI|nr:translation factor [Malassezia pachydermatis]KOS15127.1 translation factor [Malassezia pachydermatis]